jgi:SOS-response transcriptional repressor LexA
MIQEPADRLQNARRHAGYLSAREASAALGWNANTYKSHENGQRGIKREMAERYGRAYGVSPAWILTGENPPDFVRSNQKLRIPNVSTRKIPKISYIAAGTFTEISDPYAEGFGEEWVSVDDNEIGPRAFALEVEGESMLPEFKSGEVIIIDPDASIKPGDYVAAKTTNAESATFKKYRARGVDADGVERIELVPLNEDHPTEHIDADRPGYLVGKMVRHIREF